LSPRARLPVDEGDVVDAERVLERRQAVQLLEHGVRVETRLDADLDPHAVVRSVRIVDVADALELLRLHRVADLSITRSGPTM
jgi:hypothetical protein